ncbi:MAG: SRPBCC domain-containing protein [Gemmatimonadetes bacterium]|nr:SRPBCC domain-containing protein [Gemmatimonadota bacterium]
MNAGEEPAAAPSRSIELSVGIAATADAVWEAIATGDGIERWFSPFASVEGGKGGTVNLAWEKGADWPSRITVWQPGKRLQMVDLSDLEAARQGTALTVDYHLTTADGTTRVHLVNSGLPATPDFDEHFHMMTNGWRVFLWNLRHAVERHPGVPRRMIRVRPWVKGSREEVWGRLFGEEGRSLKAGDSFHFDLDGGEALAGEVVLCDRPWAFAGMVESLNDGVLHVEMEGSGEKWKVGVWLSAYGVGAGRCLCL